ncbi:MAG TPA: ComEC/Rec2 family competence protein [Candidatus Fimivivens sp.]|nr:ComEC/Rec2 family competence protein [Candidatus Fimivivens sp.]
MDFASCIRRAFPFVIPGVFAGSLFPSEAAVPFFALAAGIMTVSIWPGRRSATFMLSMLAFAAGFLFSSRAESAWNRERPAASVSGTVTIVRNPETDVKGIVTVFRFDTCTEETTCPRELVLGTFSIRSDVSYGDTGTLSCDVEPPDATWRMYYAKDRVAYRCRVSSWKKTGFRYPVLRALFGFSRRFKEALSRALPEPEAGLAVGLVVGGSRQLPDAVVSDFRDAGLSHVVAVSGYNISIIAGCFLLLGIALCLSRPHAAVFSLLATAAFVLISGAPASAVRAFGMSATLVSAGWFGRRYASINAIIIVASVMVVLNPLILRHDVGFLLSFAATVGIALSSPYIGRIVKWVSHGRLFVEAALLTFCANLFVMPVIFANFGAFSPVSFLANAIILPLVPYAMFFSALVGAVGMVVPSFGSLLSFPAYAAIRPIILGTEYMALLSRRAMIHTGFGWVASIVWYVTLGLTFLIIDKKRRVTVPEVGRDVLQK